MNRKSCILGEELKQNTTDRDMTRAPSKDTARDRIPSTIKRHNQGQDPNTSGTARKDEDQAPTEGVWERSKR